MKIKILEMLKWLFRGIALISIAYGIDKANLNAIVGIFSFFLLEGIIVLVDRSWFKNKDQNDEKG